MEFEQAIRKDKNLYSRSDLPIITIYDDNWFLRNDYDVLSLGQRNYLINFFKNQGFVQTSGKILTKGEVTITLPRPQQNLAISAYQTSFIESSETEIFCVTPTQFAEALFYRAVRQGDSQEMLISQLKELIETCPYNIEWLRDISYHTPIEQLTLDTYSLLTTFQKETIELKFKKKKSLR